MTEPGERADELSRVAERCDALADTAELMGDDAGAERFRELAIRRRLAAMARLDE